MKKINIICVGNLKEKYFKEAVAEYQKRLKPYCDLNIIEIQESMLVKNNESEINKVKEKEGQAIISKLNDGYNILLDLDGVNITSEELSVKINKIYLSNNLINFVIGGSYGVSCEVKEKINDKIAFGKITYPHQLIRVILVEQIYRQFKIKEGSAYHK